MAEGNTSECGIIFASTQKISSVSNAKALHQGLLILMDTQDNT
jgi:hypothetical protein